MMQIRDLLFLGLLFLFRSIFEGKFRLIDGNGGADKKLCDVFSEAQV